MTHSSIYKLAYHRTHAPVSSLKDAKGLNTFISRAHKREHAWLPTDHEVAFKAVHVIFCGPGHPIRIQPGERVRVIQQGDADTPSVIRVISK